ncbi:MAG: hypothetical protein RIT45_4134 [Pseudomonadota bacterium]
MQKRWTSWLVGGALLCAVAGCGSDGSTGTDASGNGGDAAVDGGADTQMSDTQVSDTTATDTTATDTTVDTTATDSSDTIAGVQCGSSKGQFPAFSKACSADADCVVVQHQINCCGTKIAIGIGKDEQAAFAAAEKLCQSQYPGCGCAQFETVAEDGYSTWQDNEFVAKCQEGVCRATVPTGKPVCSENGMTAPKPPKACGKTSDCAIAMKTIDCCGSQQAVGVAKFAKDAFEKAEFSCSNGMAVCDCAPKPLQFEDGLSGGDGLMAVQCEDGLCQTYAK